MLLGKKISKQAVIEKHNKKQIEAILSTDDNIHPLIYLHYNQEIKILEAPLFYTSSNKIKDLILYLRSHGFTGLEGNLLPDRTDDIINMTNGSEFLKFLSIFSGKLYRLRSKYLFESLQQGHALNFKNSLIGYHYHEIFRSSQALGRNKNIPSLIHIIQTKFPNIQINYNSSYKWVKSQKSANILGNILLGNKLIVKTLHIKFFLHSYDILLKNMEDFKKLNSVISIYSPFYKINFSIPSGNKLPLGKYLLGI